MTALDDTLKAGLIQAVAARLNQDVAAAAGADPADYPAVIAGADAFVADLLTAGAVYTGDLADDVAPLVTQVLTSATQTAADVAFAQANPPLAYLVGLDEVSPERLARLAAAAAATATAWAPAEVTAAVADVLDLLP